MKRLPLIVLVSTLGLSGGFLASCGSDYGINTDKDDNEDNDDDDIDQDTFDPDTSVPDDVDTGDTQDPDDELAPPVAVCSVTPAQLRPIVDKADWIGTDSYDPEGGTITQYSWTLSSQPAGSSATMPGGAGPIRSNFYPDLAGSYMGTLTVTTQDGRTSNPCTAELIAIPSENLWVELYWTYDDDDLDLHMTRPGYSSSALMTDNDCYYANCVTTWGTLDWGVWGDSSDDPALDLDDIPGTGPENINIQAPENGDFTVYVHDYQYSTGDTAPANPATVNIYVAGSLVWTGTKSITIEDSYIPFAMVSWPSGTVTPL
jgi:hypothetical protein